MLVAVLRDLLGLFLCRLVLVLRLHEFDGLHGAKAAHFPDHRPAHLPLAGTLLECIAELARASIQILLFEHVEHSKRRLTGDGISGESASETAGARSVHNFGSTSDGPERKSSPDRLRGHDDVWLDPVALAGKQSARAPEPRLHLVSDEENPVLVTDLQQLLEIIQRRRDKAAFSEYRLSNHRRHCFLRNHAFKGVFQVPRAIEFATRISQRIGAAIAIRVRDPVNLSWQWLKTGFVRMGFARQ